jgi:hypothetical protein
MKTLRISPVKSSEERKKKSHASGLQLRTEREAVLAYFNPDTARYTDKCPF